MSTKNQVHPDANENSSSSNDSRRLLLREKSESNNGPRPSSAYNGALPSNGSVTGYSRFQDIVLENEVRAEQQGVVDLPQYKRLKLVGSGSFGIAVLYQRDSDGAHVVIKQISLTDLTPLERQLAMNEVVVFSKLHHPNIIQYFNSFIKSDTLLIEMEYADGGTLAHLINERDSKNRFSERFILGIFEQIVSAINYMHEEGIMHRDLKTANIFLTKKGIVKIGDFGISKIINTKIHAQTVLGTPYYFSPEMCEGREYDEKSDIWALGCVLGEMCCLKKSFSAQNLSELISKITTAQYNPIPSGYSDGLRYLLKLLLQVSAYDRPSASEVLKYWIPFILRSLGKQNGYNYIRGRYRDKSQEGGDGSKDNDGATASTSTDTATSIRYFNQSTATVHNLPLRERTVLYQLKSFGTTTSVMPIHLPADIKVTYLSTSSHHFIAVAEEGKAYTWGEGNKGQLGHNAVESWKHFPTRVEALNYHKVIGACAGDGFSIFWTDLGVVLTCGDNSHGSLGHLDLKSSLVPKRIQHLDGVKIVKVACGSKHVIALSSMLDLYVWGGSSEGALGLGNQIHQLVTPTRLVNIQAIQKIQDIECGPDCSMVLNERGEVYCCGNNCYNKLGIGNKIDNSFVLKKITVFKDKKVVRMSVGTTHSAFVLEGGFVVTLGNNEEGQRGFEGKKEKVLQQPQLLKSLQSRMVVAVRCFTTYTVAITDDNCVIFWGTRFGIPNYEEDDEVEPNRPKLQQMEMWGNSTTAFTNFLASIYKTETIFDPVDILAVYSSPEQLQKGHYIRILSVHPLIHSVLVLVETTTPLPD